MVLPLAPHAERGVFVERPRQRCGRSCGRPELAEIPFGEGCEQRSGARHRAVDGDRRTKLPVDLLDDGGRRQVQIARTQRHGNDGRLPFPIVRIKPVRVLVQQRGLACTGDALHDHRAPNPAMLCAIDGRIQQLELLIAPSKNQRVSTVAPLGQTGERRANVRWKRVMGHPHHHTRELPCRWPDAERRGVRQNFGDECWERGRLARMQAERLPSMYSSRNP